MVLWSLIDRARLRTPNYNHDKLYDLLDLSPDTFTTVRKKLEAIGLITVYQNEEQYLYELKAPLSAEEFIKDGSLGAYLFSKIGKINFDELVGLFRVSTIEKDGFKNITTNFDEIFSSVVQPIEVKETLISKSKSKIEINHDFDFDIFFEGLSKNFVDHRKITKKIKEKIRSLSYVYNLDEFTMQRAFLDVVKKDKSIDIDDLSKRARYWFTFENKTNKPNEKVEEEINKPLSNDEVLELCKTSNPLGIIEAVTGSKPAVSELKTIDNLIDNFDVDSELINFLFVYVWSITKDVPPYSYFEKVITGWVRNDITTLEQAIKHIKARNNRRTQKKTNTYAKNVLPKDVESDWLDDYLKKL